MANRKIRKSESNPEPSTTRGFNKYWSTIKPFIPVVTVLGGIFTTGYHVGSAFKENSMKIEIFDMKVAHRKKIDSLHSTISKYKEEVKIIKNRKSNEK